MPPIGDGAMWNVTLTNTKGAEYKISGYICLDPQLVGLSELIRKRLECDYLFVFDGNPNYIFNLTIDYLSKPKRSTLYSKADNNTKFSECKERLVLDRLSETLEYTRELSSGRKVKNTLYLKNEISIFLEDISVDEFSKIKSNHPDAIDDSEIIREYAITVVPKHGKNRVVTGTFDKNSLPEYWIEFIDRVRDFLTLYGFGEIFDEHLYLKEKRRKSDLTFCNVKFDNSDRTYCYLSDYDGYSTGDLVVVPVGPDNQETLATITTVEFHTAEEAPYPLEKIKRIIQFN